MMKFFIAILVAFLCTTATAEFSMHDIILSLPLADIEKNLNKYSSNIQCVRGVVDNVLSEHEINALWETSKSKTAELANVDMKKCMEIKDPEEHMK